MPRPRDDYDDDLPPRRSRRRDEDEYDRPRRRDRDDNEEQPRRPPPRRAYRDDDDEDPRDQPSAAGGMPGLAALICGIVSLGLAFIPCVGLIGIAGGFLGLFLSSAGMKAARESGRSKALPRVGALVSTLSIVAAGAWFMVWANARDRGKIAEVEAADAIVVPAGQLCRDYEANVFGADETYKGKVLEVTGEVKRISTVRKHQLTVELGSQNDTVQCDFRSVNESDVKGVTIGQTVTIRGKCTGMDRQSNYVILETCVLKSKASAEPAVEGPDEKTTAKELLKAYEDDDVAADKRYKNKILEVSGTLGEITRPAKGETVVHFLGDGTWSVECRLTQEARSAGLRKGQKVTIRGTCVGSQRNTVVLLENVSVVN